jgi:hypothetical protein
MPRASLMSWSPRIGGGHLLVPRVCTRGLSLSGTGTYDGPMVAAPSPRGVRVWPTHWSRPYPSKGRVKLTAERRPCSSREPVFLAAPSHAIGLEPVKAIVAGLQTN